MRRFLLSIAAAALCLMPVAITTGTGSDARIIVINQAAAAIDALYISPDFRGRWGGDRLLGRTLGPGERVSVTLPDSAGACFFDIRLVTAAGESLALWGRDLCGRTALTLSAP